MSRQSIPDLSRLYRAGAQEEPPDWLDGQIEAAARAPRHGASAWKRAGWRWSLPLALAATVVLSTSIALRIHNEGTDPAGELLAKASSGDDGAASATERPASIPRELVTEPDSATASGEGRALPSQSSPSSKTPTASARAIENRAKAAEASPHFADRAPSADSSIALPDPPVAASPALPPVELRAEARPAKESSTPERADSRQPVQSVKRAEAFARTSKEEPVSREDRLGLQLAHDPEAWLRHIAKLRHEGHEVEARESLAAFRRRFPDHPVPSELMQSSAP